MKLDLYQDVTACIIAELERGAAPWVKPWSVTPGQNTPQNAVTNRPYSGCNVILLWPSRDRGWTTPRFLTFKQAIEAGGNVRKGEHGTKVYFVKQLRVKDGDEADTRLVPMLREYTVFNVDQCDSLPDSIRSTSSPCVQANTSARFPSAQRYSAVARGMCRLQLVRWIIYD